MDTERVREAARSAARELGYTDLKQEQLRVVEAFVEGRDVFAVLPTGYGKSLCYACLPIVFDKLLEMGGGGGGGGGGRELTVYVVVVSSLTAIIQYALRNHVIIYIPTVQTAL